MFFLRLTQPLENMFHWLLSSSSTCFFFFYFHSISFWTCSHLKNNQRTLFKSLNLLQLICSSWFITKPFEGILYTHHELSLTSYSFLNLLQSGFFFPTVPLKLQLPRKLAISTSLNQMSISQSYLALVSKTICQSGWQLFSRKHSLLC